MADLIAHETHYGSIELEDALEEGEILVEVPASALPQSTVIALLGQLGMSIDLDDTRLKT